MDAQYTESVAGSADRIEQQELLRAPQDRVWRAISDASEFGCWFPVALEGPFVAGQSVSGRITYPGYDGLRLTLEVKTLRAPDYFAFYWHPYATDPMRDYSGEPQTLVEFHMSAAEGGTLLRIVESGFALLPVERREEAWRMNNGGWLEQLENIRKYLAA